MPHCKEQTFSFFGKLELILIQNICDPDIHSPNLASDTYHIWKSIEIYIDGSMEDCITPLLMNWSYHCLALSHRNINIYIYNTIISLFHKSLQLCDRWWSDAEWHQGISCQIIVFFMRSMKLMTLWGVRLKELNFSFLDIFNNLL